ncbi:hypothetical protein ACFPRL_33580 [Pseudoclavibacter helvolus]
MQVGRKDPALLAPSIQRVEVGALCEGIAQLFPVGRPSAEAVSHFGRDVEVLGVDASVVCEEEAVGGPLW